MITKFTEQTRAMALRSCH